MFAVAVRLTVTGMSLLLLLQSVAGAAASPSADQAVIDKANTLWHDPSSPVLGNPHGDVVVVEFFDYACPYCKAIEPR
ncbi:MAG: thioredoxin domain-containing protein, partial [Steroidobacteraceae bacterium]